MINIGFRASFRSVAPVSMYLSVTLSLALKLCILMLLPCNKTEANLGGGKFRENVGRSRDIDLDVALTFFLCPANFRGEGENAPLLPLHRASSSLGNTISHCRIYFEDSY